jgi:hypothetical protein
MNDKAILAWVCIILFVGCGCWVYGQGLDELAGKTAGSILEYFSDKYNVSVSIINFENYSGISEQAAQKFYQLLVSRLETAGNISYTDLMIDFRENKGEFNLNRIDPLNHLVYIRLTRNKTRIGAGISIFSRTLDKTVHIKYVESDFVQPEEEIMGADHFGFTGAGFSKIIEMDAQKDLLDVRSIMDQQGRSLLLFFYPGKIDFFKFQENQAVKLSSYKLNWTKPYYPVKEAEGRLCVFLNGDAVVVTVGSNFSKYSRVISFSPGGLEEVGAEDVDFVPFRRIELNGAIYLAGARYALGKNYFESNLILAPFQPGQSLKESQYFLEKQAPQFYALDFSTRENSGVLNSIHIIDRDYVYRFLGDNFEQSVVERSERGAALCSMGGQWLAMSDFSSGVDKLYFYKIENGARQLVFENKTDGEIVFISDGMWGAAPGFWVYVKKLPAAPDGKQGKAPGYTVYKLQFWSKKSE